MKSTLMLTAAVVMVVGGMALSAGADTMNVTLTPEDGPRSGYVWKNGGTGLTGRASTSTLYVGGESDAYMRRGLVGFDLSQLVNGSGDKLYSSIDSLKFRLDIARVTGGSSDISIFDVTQADGDWTLTTMDWSMTYNTPALATFTCVAGVVEVTLTGDLTGLIDSNNAGLMLIGNETSTDNKYFTYDRGGEELLVGYTPVPEPATMAMLGLGGVMMLVRRRRKTA